MISHSSCCCLFRGQEQKVNYESYRVSERHDFFEGQRGKDSHKGVPCVSVFTRFVTVAELDLCSSLQFELTTDMEYNLCG